MSEVDENRPLDSILREFRLFHRRILSLIDHSKKLLENEPILSKDSQILDVSSTQLQTYQNRLDQLISEIFEQDPTLVEENEVSEKATATSLAVAEIIGTIRDAQQRANLNSIDNQNRRSVFSSTIMNQSQNLSQSKMPKIKLPTFDGNEQKFLDFKNHFLRVVDANPSLSPAEKMSYLKSSLVGKAEMILFNIDVSDANYKIAWDAVVDRYEDKLAIVEGQFRVFFAIPKIKSGKDIQDLIDQVEMSLRSLELCGENPKGWPGVITYFVYSRLDEQTQIDWKKTLSDRKFYPTWDNLRSFLKVAAGALKNTHPWPPNKKESKSTEVRKSFVINSKLCFLCNQAHLLIECPTFLSKTPKQRLESVKGQSLCFNCFNPGHINFDCKSRKVCKTCRRKHHTLLHFESSKDRSSIVDPKLEAKSDEKIEKPKPNETQPSVNTTCLNVTSNGNEIVILPSAVTRFQSGNNHGTLRLLLDSCSQVSLITDIFVRRFRIPTFKTESPTYLAVGGIKTLAVRQCSLVIRSRVNNFSLQVTANVVPSNALSYSLLAENDPKLQQAFQSFEPADPIFLKKLINLPSVEMLLGGSYLPKIFLKGIEKVDSFALQNTEFGWTILGPISNNSIQILPDVDVSCNLAIQDIDDRLRKFWECEELPQLPEIRQRGEFDACEEHFNKNYVRLENGQFQVRLPLKESRTVLSDNRSRTLAYQRRFEKNMTEITKPMYAEFMNEYLSLNHMSRTSSEVVQRYFIPLQGVLKPSSTTTKFRVVFNASAKTASGKSLNDILMTGPSIQPDLFDTLIRFRSYPIAFTADIKHMYRCVLIHPEDRPLQSILWQEDPDLPHQEFQLNTITYGTTSASFLATKCLAVLADSANDEKTKCAVKSSFYMDDLLVGAQNIEEAVELRQNIHTLLDSAGFVLRKYQSNSCAVMKSIPPELIEKQLIRCIGDRDAISILGLQWVTTDDVFAVRIPDTSKISQKKLTKRILLSEIGKIFDPLGLISPVTIREKIIIQRLWQAGLLWDDAVSEELAKMFYKFREDLQLLKSVTVPRCLVRDNNIEHSLIGFCDASPQAYCAVLYYQSFDNCASATVRLICAKTRVAPLKGITIPKLELCAAVLLSQLMSRVSLILKIDPSSIYAFSDSQVVLSWLAKPPEVWKTFVANRTTKILDKIPFSRWGYVPSEENPADLGTRGLSVDIFLKSSLWYNGPAFLEYPIVIKPRIDNDITLEKRKTQITCNVIVNLDDYLIEYFSRFSSYTRLIRVFAYVNRFIINMKDIIKYKRDGKMSPNSGKLNKTCRPLILTADDLIVSDNLIMRITQYHYFSREIMYLFQEKPVGKKSPLRSLNPFIDSDGMLRLATRLSKANFSYNRKCPIVLHTRSHYVKLLIQYIHQKYFHATKAFILTHLTLRYYIVGGLSNMVKSNIHRCTTCIRYVHERNRQIMGDLPKERLMVSRPFSFVGIDFAGPFTCKPIVKRSKVKLKSYAAVFVCFASRAVHLEVVSSLTSADFLNAFKRFVSRRGMPNTVYSDNGTNFKGASNHLNFQCKKIQGLAANEKVKWIFNPPHAPHRGSIWEAAVKSMKAHLYRSTKDQVMTFEELSTVLAQVECILNSRPLAYRKVTEKNNEVLCPSHLLIGEQLTSVPESELSPVKLSTHYKALRARINSFWYLWSKDYISQLRSREKWQTNIKPIVEGEIVIVKNVEYRPSAWPLGRVTKVFADPSQAVHTVEVAINGENKIRDVSALVRLPDGADVSTSPPSGGE